MLKLKCSLISAAIAIVGAATVTRHLAASSYTQYMYAGDELNGGAGDTLTSSQGGYKLKMVFTLTGYFGEAAWYMAWIEVANNGLLWNSLSDGNGGDRFGDHIAQWSLCTNGSDNPSALMQDDGNFVMYDSNDVSCWATQTNPNSGAWLGAQDDSNLVVYTGEGAPLWALF